MTFKLSIDLGNDGMQSAEDIAVSLIALAGRLRMRGIGGNIRYPITSRDGAKIMDYNGNSVGKWEVVGD
jgi:hypothetical protein